MGYNIFYLITDTNTGNKYLINLDNVISVEKKGNNLTISFNRGNSTKDIDMLAGNYSQKEALEKLFNELVKSTGIQEG